MSDKKKPSEKKPGASESQAVSFYDSYAGEYDAWFDEAGRLIFENEVSALGELLPELPKPWLEVGIGSGRFAMALGIDKGIDPSVKMAELARKRGIHVVFSKGEKLPFADASFGTVFLLFTLCFVDSVEDVLREAYRVIQPGGKVVVGEVMRDSPYGRYYEQKQDEHRWYRYSKFCRYEDLNTLLAKAGFTVAKVLSTLFQEPGEVLNLEVPREGYSPQAGFTVMVGVKASRDEGTGTR